MQTSASPPIPTYSASLSRAQHPRKTPGLGSHLGAVSSWRPNKANWLPVSELSAKVIADELQQQRRPIWYTSCYAAADRDGNLRTGDVSPEELRLMACEARNKGEMNQYVSQASAVVALSALTALHFVRWLKRLD